ncbi:hypothetical protein D3218_02050 [Aureimonas flava]|uniref:DUF2125 domain-containing protein n=1 Tax=Aureimonas flava TaxID=2320271 RepID=A0A3A1WXW4_9HYPH|nr:hypothetical protein [Aureimonas flava]RIY03559.1 hypothetical protein D3218_02050 [Aureimonas flava]
MRVLPSRRILAGLAFVLAGTTSSLAADAQAFADRLKAVMADQKVTLSFAGATSEGDDVLLRSATVRGAAPGEDAVSLGDLRFEDVSGSTADGWRVARVAPGDIDRTDGPTRTRVSGIVVEGLQIEGTNATTPSVSPLFLDRIAVASASVERDGQGLASLQGVETRMAAGAEGGYSGTFGVQSFTVDTQPADGGRGSAVMADLGYRQFTGNVLGSASWNPQSGALTLDPLQVVVNDAGTLDFSYTLTGYTPSFIQSLSQISQQMQANGGQNDASGMAVIGLISQLYLQSAELAFTDASLTNRLLDYYAKQNNQTREQMVSGLVGSLPLALAYIQNPEFQAQVTGAVKDFLENPQSLRISIAPPAPVPATQILGAAMGAPQTLPQVLNLSVRSGN